MEAREEKELIARVMDGDQRAYADLVRACQGPIYNLMHRMTGSPEDARDLTQDAFVRAYDKLDTFKRGNRFFPWLYSIAMNIARDFLRKKRIKTVSTDELVRGEEGLAADGPEDPEWLIKLSVRDVGKAMMDLPDTTREALILRFKEELSVKEVSLALGLSVSAAKMRLSRGLAALRSSLAKEGGGRELT